MTLKNFKKPTLTIQIGIAILLGVVIGLVFKEKTSELGELGKLIIQLVKTLATPLLFLSIIHAILSTKISGKHAGRMLTIAMINAVIALIIGLGISNLLKPGLHLQEALSNSSISTQSTSITPQKLEFSKVISQFFPASIVDPFQQNSMITIVVFALLLGFAFRKLTHLNGFTHTVEVIEVLLKASETILHWVIVLIPVAVFSVVAKTVGQYGFTPLKGLGYYVLTGLLGLTLHVLITHQAWIKFYCKKSLKLFWKTAKEPIIYSIGTNSSLATLPLTLKALDKLGVSKSSSTLGACVGTNLNNDGIILYEGMALLFVAQASGIELNLTQQLLASFSCLVAAMGIAGIPEAGFISLSIVLSTVGLPLELLPLLLTVDWILARARSVVNVISDMVVSISVDKST